MVPTEGSGKVLDALGVIGRIVAVIAGIVLFTSQTQDPTSYLQTIAHGIGLYFIGKGLYMVHGVARRAAQVWFLQSIRDAELAEDKES